jgi:hypothetical protein
MADTCRCRVALLVRLLVARTSGYQVASLVQDAAKRLILLHRRSPKPPGSGADGRYKARSAPQIQRSICAPAGDLASGVDPQNRRAAMPNPAPPGDSSPAETSGGNALSERLQRCLRSRRGTLAAATRTARRNPRSACQHFASRVSRTPGARARQRPCDALRAHEYSFCGAPDLPLRAGATRLGRGSASGRRFGSAGSPSTETLSSRHGFSSSCAMCKRNPKLRARPLTVVREPVAASAATYIVESKPARRLPTCKNC